MEEGKYKLAIGIPTYGKPDSMFAIDSGWSMMFHIGRRHPEIETVWVQRDVRTYRQEARKGIVEGALQMGATHLLMLDDDHVFNGEVFDKLWEHKDKPMVSALYMTRSYPPAPCIFKLTRMGTVPMYYYEPDSLIEVDVVGFGFVLFDMEVFKRVNPPWFNLGYGFGEDAAFCARLLNSGMKVYCHTGAKVGHIHEAPRVITEEDYLAVRERVDANVGTPQLVQHGEINSTFSPLLRTRPWWRPNPKHWWKAKGAPVEARPDDREAEGSVAGGEDNPGQAEHEAKSEEGN